MYIGATYILPILFISYWFGANFENVQTMKIITIAVGIQPLSSLDTSRFPCLLFIRMQQNKIIGFAVRLRVDYFINYNVLF